MSIFGHLTGGVILLMPTFMHESHLDHHRALGKTINNSMGVGFDFAGL